MQTKIITILAAAVILCFTGSELTAVEDKIFTSDGVIMEGDDYANVYIYDTPPDRTTVNMSGGSAYNMMSYDSSILNMTGGTTEVFAYDESTINVGGGGIPTLVARSSSAVNVFGGSVYGLEAYDTVTIQVQSNTNIDILRARGHSLAEVTGGTLDLISASEFGTVNLLGGLVTDYLAAGDSGIINIYGYRLTKIDTGGHYGSGFVSGEWLDKTAFNIDLSGADTYSRVILHEIPEPATVLLIAVGSVCLGKRRSMKEKT